MSPAKPKLTAWCSQVVVATTPGPHFIKNNGVSGRPPPPARPSGPRFGEPGKPAFGLRATGMSAREWLWV